MNASWVSCLKQNPLKDLLPIKDDNFKVKVMFYSIQRLLLLFKELQILEILKTVSSENTISSAFLVGLYKFGQRDIGL